MSASLCPHGLYGPWNSPGQNTGGGGLSLLQRIFPAQGSNPGLLDYGWILYQLSYQGSSPFMFKVIIHTYVPIGASLVAQLIKNLSAMQETPVPFLGWKDPLEKG